MSLQEWLISGERGLSREAIVKAATNAPDYQDAMHDWPRDPADLRRCILLLEAAPWVWKGVTTMARESPKWAAMEANWKKLDRILRAEIGQELALEPGLEAPLTYDRMQALLYGDGA